MRDDGSDLETTFADPPTHSSFAGARSRGSAFRSVRLWLALAGLSLVPLAGLGYAAFADFGPTPEAAAGDAAEDDVDGADPASGQRAGRGAKRAKARTDGAAACCKKLRDLGKTAPIADRASFLAAASSCDAAPTEERALSQVSSVLGGSRVAIPDECAGGD